MSDHYRYTGPLPELYRELQNPWLRAKDVAKKLDCTMAQTSTRLSHYAHLGVMETRYQRPRTEYRYVKGALGQESHYRELHRGRQSKAVVPFVRELESAGYRDAARFLTEKFMEAR